MDEINELENLLQVTLGTTKEIKRKRITSLTAPGDNYGSLMLKLDIVVFDKTSKKEEEWFLVAKKIPHSEIYQKMFNIQVTFKKEIAFYNTIVPVLQKFLNEKVNKNLEFFPKYYASRFNLKNNDEVVDEDGVLILENLKISGYSNIERRTGFDLETTKLILRDLAYFHAVPLALRIKNPKIFNEKIKPYLSDKSFSNDRYKEIGKYSAKLVSENPQCSLIKQKINFLNAVNKQVTSEMYATVIHFDMWVNNIMLKFDKNKAISGTKLVDFQVFQYGSPGSDLFFFLFTSVQDEIIVNGLDTLIEYYYVQFIQILEELNCDTSPYTLQSLYDEIKTHSKFEFGHAFFFNVFVINAEKEEEDKESGGIQSLIKKISQRSKEKAWFMTLECEKRGWVPKLE